MSNLYERPLPLIPAPQQLTLTDAAWRPPRGWKFFDAPRGRAWAFAADARAARQLLARAPRLKEKKPEAYALTTLENGAVAVGHDPAGLRHSRTTLGQLLQLTEDGPLPQVEIHDWPDLEVRGVHLDLKYMMHSKDYLMRWLEDLAFHKINALLLEYEDKFPYRQSVLRHPAAFTERELRDFLDHARARGLRVIPLIQTLGHVEYILKHDQFARLRKNGFHTEYDTLHPETWPFAREMLDEVLEFHETDEWFHIGGDECWHLKQEHPALKARRYGDHMAKVLNYIVQRGKRPLLWDDMIRSLPDRELGVVLRRLPKETILCYWNYDSTPRAPSRGEGFEAKAAVTPTKGGQIGRRHGSPRGCGVAAIGLDQPRRWAEYRQAGFDVLAIPCHDWGPIVPFYARYTVPNTLAMIRDAVRYDCPGVINSHWASFHCPLPLQDYGIAVTADRAWKVSAIPDVRDFDEAYCRLRFGLTDRMFLEALFQMDGMIEMPTNLGRGIHLPYWYYMDAVLHYPNGHVDRVKYGPIAPPDEVDHTAIVRKKLTLLSKSATRLASLRALERFRGQADAARRLLIGIRGERRRARELFDLVFWLAEFRRHAAQRMLALARRAKSAERETLLRQSRRLRGAMRRIYRPFMDARDYVHEEASLFDGEENLLKQP